MSKELTGRNGKIVGSAEYFKALHQKHLIGELMREPDGTDHYGGLREAASRIRDAAQEIYDDLKKHVGVVRHIPKEDREELIKVLRGLREVCEITSSGSGRCGDCISVLNLSDSGTRAKSGASDREIAEAAKSVRDGSFLTRSARMELIRKAAERGEQSASGDLERVLFLRALAKGRGREFFQDVWLKLSWAEEPRRFTGRCGRVLCSREYIEAVEQRAFGRSLPSGTGGRSGDRAYGKLLRTSLEEVAKEIQRDLEQGARDNDYIRDENADKLKSAAKSLERCGVRCYSLGKKVDDLAWFVGGDPDKILKLQKALNELGVGERLKEDGVYGKKTDRAVKYFFDRLQQGSFPTIAYLDPLQSKATKIYSKPIDTKYGPVWTLQDFSKRSHNIKKEINRGVVVFRVDQPHKDAMFPHLNTVKGSDIANGTYAATTRQAKHLNKWNHTQISDDAYKLLKNFDGVAKKVRIGGTVLLAAGEVLDIIELCKIIEPQLQEGDKKLDKETWSSIASMGGSWVFSAAGSKFGAWAGAAIGTAIMPGVGTAIGGVMGGVVLGTVGSTAGDQLGRFLVNITVLEE